MVVIRKLIFKMIPKEGNSSIILLSSEPFPFAEEHTSVVGHYTLHAKTIFVDDEMFSWHGSRLLKAFQYFKNLHEKL